MPFDALGRTRATMMNATSNYTDFACYSFFERNGESFECSSSWGQTIGIVGLERGIPSKRKSSACVDYVPALCTHRPSLVPIEWLSEASGSAQRRGQLHLRAENLVKLGHLEELKVVTRFPQVNLRKDHYRNIIIRCFAWRHILPNQRLIARFGGSLQLSSTITHCGDFIILCMLLWAASAAQR